MSESDQKDESRTQPRQESPAGDSSPSLPKPDPTDVKAQMEALADIVTTAYDKGWCKITPESPEDDELYLDEEEAETREHLKNLLSRDD